MEPFLLLAIAKAALHVWKHKSAATKVNGGPFLRSYGAIELRRRFQLRPPAGILKTLHQRRARDEPSPDVSNALMHLTWIALREDVRGL